MPLRVLQRACYCRLDIQALIVDIRCRTCSVPRCRSKLSTLKGLQAPKNPANQPRKLVKRYRAMKRLVCFFRQPNNSEPSDYAQTSDPALGWVGLTANLKLEGLNRVGARHYSTFPGRLPLTFDCQRHQSKQQYNWMYGLCHCGRADRRSEKGWILYMP